MESNKNSLLFGLIEEKYGTRLTDLRTGESDKEERLASDLSPASSSKVKRRSVLNTIKKMVKLEYHQNSEFPVTGSGFIRKWKNTYQGGAGGSSSIPVADTDSKVCSTFEWWEPPKDSLPVEFCQDTSLHGLKYIGQSKRHVSERIFWLLTFLVGLFVAVWLISEMWNKYKHSPVIVSFQPFETNVDQVPFPAVTVCNMNKVMKSKAEAFLRGAEEGDPQAVEDVYYMQHVCTSTQSFARRFNFTQKQESDYSRINGTPSTEKLTKVNDFLRRAAQNCTDMIKLCVWHDQEIDCSQLFRPIETEFGKCCTFNMIPLSLLYTRRNDSRETADEIEQWQKWNIDEGGLLLPTSADGPQFPRRQMKAGLTNGLSFLLNVDSSEYYCTSSDSVGFRMATHLPVELPKVADFGISLRPKSEIFVDVVPQITMVDQDIFGFSLNKRNCYKNGEFKLENYKYYSVNNCIDECIANETIRDCGCKRYYMPRTLNESLCGPLKFECAEEVRYKKTKLGIRNTCSDCFQSCTEVYYEQQATSTPLRRGIWNFANGTTAKWKDDDVSIVHVFIGQDSFYAKVRKELYGPTDLFANTGGLMGLCLGFSGLSFIELIYFLTLRAWWKAKRKTAVVTREEEEERPSKWARKSITPPSAKSTEKEEKRTGNSAYFRSVFGEVRGEGTG